ncbi:MAG: serine/threonine protein kinase [Myxococcales bacterium]|nr:serine/threonine protein kinase [Myxococcales bacterium]
MRRTKQLGRYQIMTRIAFGGMAEIFRGFTYEEGFRKDIAIKKVLPYYLEEPQFLDMLTDEFKLVSHLRHPNIAEVYELAEVERSLLIAMEYVDGKDLRSIIDRLQSRGMLMELDNAAYIIARALDGLHHAHCARDRRGEVLAIVHRDFSPSNVLVSYDGRIKICDFGIAKARHSRIRTKTGIIKGKIRYMSPEQTYGRTLDLRSDIFSAGSVVYELATGQPAFHADNEMDLIFAVREAAPPACQDVNPRVPDQLARIIERAMARSRSGRYQTSIEFRDALLEFIRTINPHYTRTKLAESQRKIWAPEIESELRAMEEYAIGDALSSDFGINLIAEVLGPDAPYSSFNPSPTRSHDDSEKRPSGRALHEMRTLMVNVQEPLSLERDITSADHVGSQDDTLETTLEHELSAEPTQVSEDSRSIHKKT